MMSLHEPKMETVYGGVSNYSIAGKSLSKMAAEETSTQQSTNKDWGLSEKMLSLHYV